MQTEWDFNYRGEDQSVTLKPGKYKLECYGASGGGWFSEWTKGAKGGYSKGELTLKKETILYVYAGETGCKPFTNGINNWTGFNGGGRGANASVDPKFVLCGGGATDIRLIRGSWSNEQGLLSRILVAGGAGAINSSDYGVGNGGGMEGSKGFDSSNAFVTGGTQYQGGIGLEDKYNGLFGRASSTGTGQGGGGGWFGGAGGLTYNAAGGSGYALTKDSYKPPGYIPTSEYYLENVVMTTGGNTTRADGYAKITLLQALPFLNISSYNSTTATFKADHTDPTLLTKIEWFIDDVLKETITTELTIEKTINYTLEDNALHTIKIVVTDSSNAKAERIFTVSKRIAQLPTGSSSEEVTNKWMEIKDAFKTGKTSIINTLALKNIEASLNNTLVELSEKIKTSFDSLDASVQDLQNRITELNNQLSQRKKWATGRYTFTREEDTINFRMVNGDSLSAVKKLIIPINLDFIPSVIIIDKMFLGSYVPAQDVQFNCVSNLADFTLGRRFYNEQWICTSSIKLDSVTQNSFTLSLQKVVPFDKVSSAIFSIINTGFTWRAYE
ncbi:glycine-rich protein [Clostridioides difficile]|nr:glycine-rich protein [Clostridioides difficile]